MIDEYFCLNIFLLRLPKFSYFLYRKLPLITLLLPHNFVRYKINFMNSETIK